MWSSDSGSRAAHGLRATEAIKASVELGVGRQLPSSHDSQHPISSADHISSPTLGRIQKRYESEGDGSSTTRPYQLLSHIPRFSYRRGHCLELNRLKQIDVNFFSRFSSPEALNCGLSGTICIIVWRYEVNDDANAMH